MGLMYSAYIKSPETHPNFNEPPTFDPQLGFENGRKERVMKVSEKEMKLARLPKEKRDYCAHLLLDYYKCKADKWPLAYRCKDSRHHWEQCQFEDYVLRMKEYEREKRLLERKKRIADKEAMQMSL